MQLYTRTNFLLIFYENYRRIVNMTTKEFFVLKTDETPFWDVEILKQHGINKVYGNYLIQKDEATYCCSITPSSYFVNIEQSFDFDSDDLRETYYNGNNDLHFTTSDDCGYIKFVKYDVKNKNHSRLIKIECEDDESVWEYVIDYFSANGGIFL